MVPHSEWKDAFHNESMCKRAFRTAALCKDNIVVIGGAVYENSKLKKQIGLREIIFLNISSVEPVINLDKDIIISSLCSSNLPSIPRFAWCFWWISKR